jgi:hypothetical protein
MIVCQKIESKGSEKDKKGFDNPGNLLSASINSGVEQHYSTQEDNRPGDGTSEPQSLRIDIKTLRRK